MTSPLSHWKDFMKNHNHDPLQIGSLSLTSRFFLGTANYPDVQTVCDCIDAGKTQLVTVGIRRISLSKNNRHSFLETIRKTGVHLLPNTAGCYTAREAVLTAHMAREALETSRIKLEVIGDDYTLYPDSVELLKAVEMLVKDSFEVFPYCTDDVVICQRLADLGCACVMPLAAPIGSGRGLQNPYNLELIKRKVSVPVVVDAGIGVPSDACRAMEMGLDAVLINTAVAQAGYPVQMAKAMRDAISAGRSAFLAKRIARKDYAQNSTPDENKIEFYQLKK